MGALAQYLEREGLATVHISLVREHTELMQPPRALWVPFMLGRPFGAPNAPEFQRRVLMSALELLEASHGPVLKDFPDHAPRETSDTEQEPLACPVSFAPTEEGNDLVKRMLEEIAQLRPWHDIAVRRSGRGASGLTGRGVEELARFAASYVDAAPLPSYDPTMSAAEALKRACDDLKAFHLEAGGAQPGNPDAAALEKWFWSETAAGRLFFMLKETCATSEDRELRLLERLLVPRVIAETFRGGPSM